ncbi:unnamed protein product [Ostreobium quekettii]|uniref:Glycine cleavage system H protein n=1 Tax=Ostreobium quekettii TaxID=121088 RepID=A0A8S1J8I9_9CHLO|nr:unnamed protein product [Ostreobium quekettii]|eukprot:evm.model.scf_410.6 EVM.evm.TU.scf_410.6   scf_410:44718-46137(-)
MALRRLAAEFGRRYGASLDGRLPGDLCYSFARAFASAKEGMKFAESHEWALADGKNATVGISDHAQAQLGDIVFVELPEVGASVAKGEPFGVVESVKAASDVYSPVSGKVVECNTALTENPGMVNKSPEDDGWLVKVELSNPAEMDGLLDSKAYDALNQE